MMRTQSEAQRRVRLEGVAWQALQLLFANLLLVLCAKIAIPLPGTPVPLTLQTFGVMLIAVLFGAHTSALAAAFYLVEGAAGLPVFQPFGAPGGMRLFGPTAGYLLAFPAAAFVAGRLIEILSARVSKSPDREDLRRVFTWIAAGSALIPAQAIILLSGWAWLASLIGAGPAFAQGVLPFLAGDLLKLAAAAAVARSVRMKL